MSDFSLTTVFVAPVSQTALPTTGSTQDLTAGQIGVFKNDYTLATSGNIAAAPYFYIAQGRSNKYLLASKRSDKIAVGATSLTGNAQTILTKANNVTEWYKVTGCATPVNQITEISGFTANCGDTITVTLRAFSSYINTLYFNGLTRSVTVQVPCCECGVDPCTEADPDTLIDLIMEKLTGYNVTSGVINWDSPIAASPTKGINPDNISLNTFFTFSKVGTGSTAKIRIEGKALTAYGNACDVAAFPFEYDKLRFRVFVYAGPATTADFIVDDSCNVIATTTTIQESSYALGTSDEIKQLEKDYYSYQAGYMKTLHIKNGYNQNFESYVSDGTIYNTYYIKFNDLTPSTYNWTDTVPMDSLVIIAVPKASAFETALVAVLNAALGTVSGDNTCITTTTTSSTTTTTTTTAG